MDKQESSILGSSVTLLASIVLLIYFKKGFWWYVGAFLVVAPIGGRIGWSLGKGNGHISEKGDKLSAKQPDKSWIKH